MPLAVTSQRTSQRERTCNDEDENARVSQDGLRWSKESSIVKLRRTSANRRTCSATMAPMKAAAVWHAFPVRTESAILNILLLAVPLAIGLHYGGASELAVFLTAA